MTASSLHGTHSEPKDALPSLPAELWLTVFENVDNIEHLWTSVRLVSKRHRSYIEQVFLSTHLPSVSISLSLPRFDPVSGLLRYRGAVLNAEVVLRYANLDPSGAYLVLKTSQSNQIGQSMDELKATGVLLQERLERASVWMWFGLHRGKGGPVDERIEIGWNDDEKVWFAKVQWERLLTTFFANKRAKRGQIQKQGQTPLRSRGP